MKPERFNKTKSVMASGAIALVVAALVIGVSSFLFGARSASSQHLGFDLTSGSSSFTITGSIYASPACSGSTALLYPGTPRCMVFSVQNNLKATISVQSITTALDTTNYPAPPPECTGTNFVLPTFSGSFNVPGSDNAASPGVPIELKDNGAAPERLPELQLPLHLHGERQLHRGLRHLHRRGLQPEPLDGGPERHLHSHGDRIGHLQSGPSPFRPDGDGHLHGQRVDHLQCRTGHLDRDHHRDRQMHGALLDDVW